MRPLLIDNSTELAAKNLVRFASEKENWYWMGCGWVPGDRPEYVLHFLSYRVVFTITVDREGKAFRHMSVSIPRKDRYPNEMAVWTICTMLGFTGAKTIGEGENLTLSPGEDWQGGRKFEGDQNCVVVIQPVVPDGG